MCLRVSLFCRRRRIRHIRLTWRLTGAILRQDGPTLHGEDKFGVARYAPWHAPPTGHICGIFRRIPFAAGLCGLARIAGLRIGGGFGGWFRRDIAWRWAVLGGTTAVRIDVRLALLCCPLRD